MKDKNFTIDNIECNLEGIDFQQSKSAYEMKTLVSQILNRNVIPVINNDMVEINTMSSADFLFSCTKNFLQNKFGTTDEISSYTALQSHYKNQIDPDLIYNIAYAIIKQNPNYFQPTDLLTKLLSIQYFPFVITTTIDPTVENTMRKIHGDKLRVLTFSNEPSQNEDIKSSFDIQQPTLYYMFGKANNNNQRFVLTDSDLLQFSRSWLLPNDSSSGAKPSNLSNAITGIDNVPGKYLLVLGNTYKDWLFRFLWFAMKGDKITSQSTEINGMNAARQEDTDILEFFMQANITSNIGDMNQFVDDLVKRVDEAQPKNQEACTQWFTYPKVHTDVFISYSRGDAQVAQKLFEILKNRGLVVWYDKQNLCAGDEFKSEIRNSIRYCKLFVPILSTTIVKQEKKEHVYRLEWEWAIDHKRQIGPKVRYIVPLCEQQFNTNDMYDYVPEKLLAHDVHEYTMQTLEENLQKFADLILKYIKEY